MTNKRCQFKNIVHQPFITEDGKEFYPRLLVKEWKDSNSFHGFHMMQRQAENKEGRSIPNVFIYEIYPPSWLFLPINQASTPLMALTPEDAFEGMIEYIDDYSKKNLEDALDIRSKVLKILGKD